MVYSKLLLCGILAGSLACTVMSGCDKTVEEKTKTTEGPNGSTVTQEKTVQHPDGTVTQEKESSTTRP